MLALFAVWAVGNDLPVRALAVVGAFTLGAFFFGWVFKLIARLMFGDKVPNWLTWLLRLLSGIVCGWLAALWLFGAGGGFGGSGGWGFGGNAGKDKAGKDDKAGKGTNDKRSTPIDPVPSDKDDKDKAKSDGPGIGTGELIRVEVLGNEPLRKLAKSAKIDPEKRYRLADAPEKLLTLQQIQDLIRQRRKQTPPLRRLQIITYRDSPANDAPVVKELQKWAQDVEDTGAGPFVVDMESLDRYAPLK